MLAQACQIGACVLALIRIYLATLISDIVALPSTALDIFEQSEIELACGTVKEK